MDYKNWHNDDFEIITLSPLLLEKAKEFKTTLLKCAELSFSAGTNDLINDQSMESLNI